MAGEDPQPARRGSGDDGVNVVELTKRFPATNPIRARLTGEVPRQIVAVDRVSLRMEQGEVFGLVGPNGAGKTTLIKMLTTLLVPTSGHATVEGLDTVRHEARVRQMVGLVTSNERSFYWRLTGRQNLAFFAALYRIPPAEARRWIDELFDLLKLADKADERFDSYSTGMRQRLAIARGLLSKPRFVFMDEPTKGVDPIAAGELVHLIREQIVGRWSPTILITSHNLTEIERLCGRIALMSRGRIVAMGTLEELRQSIGGVDRFRLRAANIPEATLRDLALRCGAARGVDVAHSNGSVEILAEFPQNSGGFGRLIRGIVESGGDVVTCTELKATLDDVFHRLVNADQSAGGDGDDTHGAPTTADQPAAPAAVGGPR